MHQKQIQEAWREKVALCAIIVILCIALAFLTFGFSIFVCTPPKNPVYKYELVKEANDPARRRFFMIHGQIYNIPAAAAKKLTPHNEDIFAEFATQDLSVYFPFSPTCPGIKFACRAPGSGIEHCHSAGMLNKLDYIGEVAFEWKDIERSGNNLLVHNGEVLDLSVYFDQVSEDSGDKPFGDEIDGILREYLGRDASKALAIYDSQTIDCLLEHFRAGQLQVKTMGCVTTDIVLYVSLVVILSLVFAKFFLAVGFAFVMARRLGRPPADNDLALRKRRARGKSAENMASEKAFSADYNDAQFDDNGILSSALKTSRYAAAHKRPNRYPDSVGGKCVCACVMEGWMNSYNVCSFDAFILLAEEEGGSSSIVSSATMVEPVPVVQRLDSTNSTTHMYTILLVTCYSEGEEGLRTTLDSLTCTDYDDNQKLLFVVADGIIKGSGNEKSTPDILIGMMELATDLFEPYYFDADGHPLPHSYVALADGTKRHNMARVYPGYYRCGVHRVPMILVVKCGTPAEADKPKPGNRGKRDSQIIIMSFLSKCLFDDRMTPLDYDMFYKIQRITGGVTPDNYELILMVDADTKVMPSALAKLVQVMRSDETIMGCCGETRIANKSDSWVTMIQVSFMSG